MFDRGLCPWTTSSVVTGSDIWSTVCRPADSELPKEMDEGGDRDSKEDNFEKNSSLLASLDCPIALEEQSTETIAASSCCCCCCCRRLLHLFWDFSSRSSFFLLTLSRRYATCLKNLFRPGRFESFPLSTCAAGSKSFSSPPTTEQMFEPRRLLLES